MRFVIRESVPLRRAAVALLTPCQGPVKISELIEDSTRSFHTPRKTCKIILATGARTRPQSLRFPPPPPLSWSSSGGAPSGGDNFTSLFQVLQTLYSQAETDVHFSNLHLVLCQNFGLNRLTPPFHGFFPSRPLHCLRTN